MSKGTVKIILKMGDYMDAEQEYYISLIERLQNLPEETEWLEFNVNNDTPDRRIHFCVEQFCYKKQHIFCGELMIKHMRLKGQVFAQNKQR